MATILHAIFGYFFLLLMVRVLSRRAGSQMALFEFVLIFMIGGVIILSTMGNDRSMTNATCAVIAVGLMHRAVSFFKARSPRFGAIIDGSPVVVIRDGVWQEEVMKSMKLKPLDIETAARSKGIDSLTDVEYAIIERNGRISIIRKQS